MDVAFTTSCAPAIDADVIDRLRDGAEIARRAAALAPAFGCRRARIQPGHARPRRAPRPPNRPRRSRPTVRSRGGAAEQRRDRASNPPTSVLSPTSRPSSSIQNVFTAPTRSASGVSASHASRIRSLCGTVTLPAARSRRAARRRVRVERRAVDVDRFVAKRNARRAQRGVLERRRERVADGMPEQDQPPGHVASRRSGAALRGDAIERRGESLPRARRRSRDRRRARRRSDR